MISETQKRAALLICQYAALSTHLDAPDPHPVSVCSFVLDPAMLRAAYKDDCLRATDAGWVCPHRGAHLGSIKPSDLGVIVCPLHGLEWDAVTGKQHFREPELPLWPSTS